MNSRFATRVLQIVSRIPPGRVLTYGDVADMAGHSGAARAVGNIMRAATRPGLPYHRVVAAGGRLGGYGGAPGLKASLLRAEGHAIRANRIVNFSVKQWTDARARPRTRHPGSRAARGATQ